MLRSIVSSSLRAFKPLHQQGRSTFTCLAVCSHHQYSCRTYCKDNKTIEIDQSTSTTTDTSTTNVSPQNVVKDVPHISFDADVDFQVDAGLTYPISLERRKYIEFDCAVCETRVKKTCTAHAYEKGVVLIKCPGCEKLHLIADHLGWTGYKGENTIEEIAQKLGKTISRTKSEE